MDPDIITQSLFLCCPRLSVLIICPVRFLQCHWSVIRRSPGCERMARHRNGVHSKHRTSNRSREVIYGLWMFSFSFHVWRVPLYCLSSAGRTWAATPAAAISVDPIGMSFTVITQGGWVGREKPKKGELLMSSGKYIVSVGGQLIRGRKAEEKPGQHVVSFPSRSVSNNEWNCECLTERRSVELEVQSPGSDKGKGTLWTIVVEYWKCAWVYHISKVSHQRIPSKPHLQKTP